MQFAFKRTNTLVYCVSALSNERLFTVETENKILQVKRTKTLRHSCPLRVMIVSEQSHAQSAVGQDHSGAVTRDKIMK